MPTPKAPLTRPVTRPPGRARHVPAAPSNPAPRAPPAAGARGRLRALRRRLLGAAASVGADDLHQLVADASTPMPYPYTAVGLLLMAEHDEGAAGDARAASGDQRGAGTPGKGRDMAVCTAFMVSEDTLLTAAHVSGARLVGDDGGCKGRPGARRRRALERRCT